MAQTLQLDVVWAGVISHLQGWTWGTYLSSGDPHPAILRGPEQPEDKVPHISVDLVKPWREDFSRASGSGNVKLYESSFVLRIAAKGKNKSEAEDRALRILRGLQQAAKGSGTYWGMSRDTVDSSRMPDADWDVDGNDSLLAKIDCTLHIYRRTT